MVKSLETPEVRDLTQGQQTQVGRSQVLTPPLSLFSSANSTWPPFATLCFGLIGYKMGKVLPLCGRGANSMSSARRHLGDRNCWGSSPKLVFSASLVGGGLCRPKGEFFHT